jgi:hypothetical protein
MRDLPSSRGRRTRPPGMASDRQPRQDHLGPTDRGVSRPPAMSAPAGTQGTVGSGWLPNGCERRRAIVGTAETPDGRACQAWLSPLASQTMATGPRYGARDPPFGMVRRACNELAESAAYWMICALSPMRSYRLPDAQNRRSRIRARSRTVAQVGLFAS